MLLRCCVAYSIPFFTSLTWETRLYESNTTHTSREYEDIFFALSFNDYRDLYRNIKIEELEIKLFIANRLIICCMNAPRLFLCCNLVKI